MANRHVSLCLLLLLLSGCASTIQPEGEEDPMALLDDVRPKHVRFIQVRINSTVVEPFSDIYSPERFDWPPSVEFAFDPYADPPNKTLVSNTIETLWTVQENDTIVIGTHNIRSNKHNVVQQTVAVAPDREAPFVYIAGIGFRFLPQGNNTMLAFFGPYTIGTFTISLNYPGHPVPMPAQLDRNALFPLYYQDYHHNYTEVEARVISNITMTYWGDATFVQKEGMLEHMRKTPDRYLYEYNRHPSRHELEGRVGMKTNICGDLLLQTYDPCMDPWMRPL